MFQRLHDRFGTAGLIVAIVALVAAIGGTAIAAGGLTAKQKKEVKKIAKGFQGTGPAGAQGPAGPQGPAGASGKDGAGGQDGVGATATSFTGSKGPIGGVTCTEGGLEVKSAGGTTLVCNGKKGATGATGATGAKGDKGDPWTAGGTLPVGATETGTLVGHSIMTKQNDTLLAPISFPIPLAAPLDGAHVVIIDPGQPNTPECEGSAAEPKAASGYLCVYLTFLHENVSVKFIGKPNLAEPGASTSGAIFLGFNQGGSPEEKDKEIEIGQGLQVAGTWAVTG